MPEDKENQNTINEEATSPETNNGFFNDVPPETGARKIPVSAQLGVLALILLVIFGTGSVKTILSKTPPNETKTSGWSIRKTESSQLEMENQDPFKDLAISADAAYVYDTKTKTVLYEKNSDTKRPLASITKLMTALVANEILDGRSSVTISSSAVLQDGDSGLAAGESFSLEKLTDLTLMSSSNDGAFAIASAAGNLIDVNEPEVSFVKAMNVRAKELGLSNTYFRNPTGLDISKDEAGAFGSAKDVATLMNYIVLNKPNILENTTDISDIIYNESGLYHEANNTNEVVSRIPGIIGSKTGYTDLSGGNLVISFNAGLDRTITVAVLGSTRNDRFTDVLKLVNAAKQALNQEQ